MATGNSTTPDPESVDWDLVSRHVDEAVSELAKTDRQAVLLRYFRRQTAREMALQFGTSEEAAQKRVARAVKRLRDQLARRGISVAAGGLANGLSSLALEPAPAGLVSSLIRQGFASGPFSAVAAAQPPLTGPSLLSMTTVQKSLAAALLIATAGTAFLQCGGAGQRVSD